jgi:hypothetical protein
MINQNRQGISSSSLGTLPRALRGDCHAVGHSAFREGRIKFEVR